MITESDNLAYTPATHAPWREILRLRWSGRLDRALVLRDRAGTYCLLSPRRGGSSAQLREVSAMRVHTPSLFSSYDSAFHVWLGERTAVRPLALPTAYGTESVEVRLNWWVDDPIWAVSTGTAHGWEFVRADLDQRLDRLARERVVDGLTLGPGDILSAVGDAPMSGSGLAYRITGVQTRRSDGELRLGQAGDAGLPYSWTANRRDEYDFCLRAVRSGPLSLAALWLQRHPDQVSQVLDWSMRNQELLRGQTRWQDEMAGLLAKLPVEMQQELTEVLRSRLVALGQQIPGAPTVDSDRGFRPPRDEAWWASAGQPGRA